MCSHEQVWLTGMLKTESARALFNEMPERNVVSWNATIAGYSYDERSV